MSNSIRIGSFNLMNLFNRYAILDQPWQNRDYENLIQAVSLASIAGRDGSLLSYETTQTQRNNTAEVILDAQPDILLVCEVENIYSLRIFNHEYLSDYFDHIILLDGNDPRGIDVGIMIKKNFSGSIRNIRTHIDDLKPGSSGSLIRESRPNFGYLANNALFSRDCLEVDVEIGDKTICLMGNHLKAQDKKSSSDTRRRQQADKIVSLVESIIPNKYPIVLGDLNADTSQNNDSGKSISHLVNHSKLVDSFYDFDDNWTHFYQSESSVSRLDYILVDKRLNIHNQQIIRKGLSKLCKQYDGDRYPTISFKGTEASDHCLISVDIEI